MKLITSPDNRIVKEAASLSEKKYRERYGAFMVEGYKLTEEAVKQNGTVKCIFIRSSASQRSQELAKEAEELGVDVFETTGDVFSKIVSTETPQDIVSVLELPRTDGAAFTEKTAGGDILVLDRLQDPGNVGTLIRTAEAMGFSGILAVKGTADPYQPKVVRAAAGSILRMPVMICEDAAAALDLIAEAGRRPFAAAAGQGSVDCSEADISGDSALIIGNEGSGVSKELLDASVCIKIPMEGRTESLNAAVAGSILMYESNRQKGLKNKR